MDSYPANGIKQAFQVPPRNITCVFPSYSYLDKFALPSLKFINSHLYSCRILIMYYWNTLSSTSQTTHKTIISDGLKGLSAPWWIYAHSQWPHPQHRIATDHGALQTRHIIEALNRPDSGYLHYLWIAILKNRRNIAELAPLDPKNPPHPWAVPQHVTGYSRGHCKKPNRHFLINLRKK